MRDVVQGLWVGDRLSTMERICIQSFLRNGHPFHLYTYDDVEGVPPEVTVLPAEVIAEPHCIGLFQNLANFSDYFRYCLLWRNGGWWVDLDTYCLKPFEFSEPYVFSSQLVIEGTNDEVNAGIIKVPAQSNFMRSCLDVVTHVDTTTNEWPALGPAVMLQMVQQFGFQHFVQPHGVFCPLNYFEAPGNLIAPGTGSVRFPDETRAIHLWNEEWRRAGADKDAEFPPDSLYERLKRSADGRD